MTTTWCCGILSILGILHTCSANSIYGYYLNTKGHEGGCADGSVEGLQGERHPRMAACGGRWAGHVANSSALCAHGWRVCGWQDTTLLKTITWKDATLLTGCYALNAAQDGGTCRECKAHLEQDDLAGVGRGCPHQSFGQKSCITGGQIDVSCCIDTHFGRACTYRPGVTSGVVCCKLPGVAPQIIVQPQALTHVTSGVTFVLSCQAMGTPTPSVQWHKAGVRLTSNHSRISVFESGYMLISHAQTEDSGDYTCTASNTAGRATVPAKILVTDYPSGCADDSTDGLHKMADIQACAGAWKGHVKRGRSLCATGWRVCGVRNTEQLQLVTWADATEMDGCYAYNAANSLNRCERCHRQGLAGIGRDCGSLRRREASCLGEGRIDVYKWSRPAGRRHKSKACHFRDGLVSGVLCCKKPSKKKVQWWRQQRSCRPKCEHGGVCQNRNQCSCPVTHKGAWCQNPVCPGGCLPNAHCARPGDCQCRPGHSGPKCRPRQCTTPCRHGAKCRAGRCRCLPSYYGQACQYKIRLRPMPEENRTE